MKKISSFAQTLSLKKHSPFLSVLCYLLIYAAIIFSGNAEIPSFATWYLKVFVLFFSSVLFILALGNHTGKGITKRSSLFSTPANETKQEEHEISSEEKETSSRV